MSKLIDILIKHEGLRLKPYNDTVGKLTVGVGRNLYDVGISKDEAMYLLNNDIEKVLFQCSKEFPWLPNLTDARKDVIYSMAFNLGMFGLLKFKKFLEAVAHGDYEEAKLEMLNSRWAMQVGNRAIELSKMMETGEY